MTHDEIQRGDRLRVKEGHHRFSGIAGSVRKIYKGEGGAWIVELENAWERVMRVRPSGLERVE